MADSEFERIGKYLRVRLEERPPGWKTDLWGVVNNDDKTLGFISWYPPWRQYNFEPELATYNHQCLTDIAAFLKRENEKRKGCRVGKGSYTIHELRTWPGPFEAMLKGGKRHEVRSNLDRKFEICDQLVLREWRRGGAGYTGRKLRARVQYVTRGGTFGLPSDIDVMTIEPVCDTCGGDREYGCVVCPDCREEVRDENVS